jgi:lysophospholipid acyltransferase (LPLAT)-like uncharacterized protein
MENLDKAKAYSDKSSYIFATWHQNILSILLAHTKKKFSMIISPSKDGQYVANVCESFGHTPIRGSSSKSALKSLVTSISMLKKGLPLAITIDGPRGPLYDVKKGIFEIARKSNTLIVPVKITPASFYCIESSWDKFKIPYPFSKIEVRYCTPIEVPSSSDKEQYDQYANEVKSVLLK